MTPVYLFPPSTRRPPAQILRYCKCSVSISYTTVPNTSRHFSYTSLIVKCRFSRMMRSTFCFNASVMNLLLQCVCDDRGSPWSLSVMNICSLIPKHYAPFSDTGRVHNMFTIDCNKSSVNFTGSNVFRLQKPNYASHLTVGGIWYRRVHCHNPLHSQREKVRCTNCTRQLSALYWTHQMTDLVQWNNCAGCMRKRSLLYEQPSYFSSTFPCFLSRPPWLLTMAT